MKLTERLRRSNHSGNSERIYVENILLTLICSDIEPRDKGVRMTLQERGRKIEVLMDAKTYSEFTEIVNDVKAQMDLIG